MHIFITGATGFVGSALLKSLLKTPHKLTALSRSADIQRAKIPQVNWIADLSQVDFNQVDAVINLAGEPIFHRPWTTQQKQRLIESRVVLTRQLSEKILSAENPPSVFISASATGFYGNQGENQLTENALPTTHFTGKLCQQWENAALAAQSENTRVCLLRTGLVFSKNGGALAKMLALYKLGLGGKLGSGNQFWAWISLQDMARGILFLLENASCQGAFNFVSPNPIRHSDFNRLLAQHLHRPAFCHAPAFILKLALGERACLLLDSQQVIPEKLLQAGFHFEFPHLPPFLETEI